VIYDKGSQPQILAHSTQLLFPVETVLAAIEVKTSVATTDINDSARKFKSVKELKPNDGRDVPITAFFGYSASSAPIVRARELNALPEGECPDVACVLDPGLVSSRKDGDLRMGAVPLHNVDADGARIAGEWIPQKKSGRVVRGNASYPVAGLELYGGWVVFEPGRALLLFAEALLTALAERTGSNVDWLSSYVTNTARETVLPPTT
jgi:hypothetical protein